MCRHRARGCGVWAPPFVGLPTRHPRPSFLGVFQRGERRRKALRGTPHTCFRDVAGGKHLGRTRDEWGTQCGGLRCLLWSIDGFLGLGPPQAPRSSSPPLGFGKWRKIGRTEAWRGNLGISASIWLMVHTPLGHIDLTKRGNDRKPKAGRCKAPLESAPSAASFFASHPRSPCLAL